MEGGAVLHHTHVDVAGIEDDRPVAVGVVDGEVEATELEAVGVLVLAHGVGPS